ncbi:hypothetical protein GGF46_005342 [Coemansia sp. RSA 552]|nr:hypothetical protein GGF46_005342 [Coemansia sp. RSA 552]
MRACLTIVATALASSALFATAAPVPRAQDPLAVRFVPGNVDWDKVDWDKVDWAAVDWSSVFSTRSLPTTPYQTPYQTPYSSSVDIPPPPAPPTTTPAIDEPSPTPKPKPEPESQPAPEPESQPAPEPETKPAPEPESQPAPEQESQPAPEPESQPQPQPPAYSSGALWGLTYSPYNDDGSCPDVGTVAAQLQKVQAVTSNIRLYSTDCSQLRSAAQAISEGKLGLSIHAGIWVRDGGGRMQSEIDEFVALAKQYGSIIKDVSVGNEEISNGISEATLIGYINKVRARLQAEGLGSIPVYTTEQDAKFTPAMAAACDLVQVNIYSIFDSIFTSVSSSVQSVIQRADSIRDAVAGGKKVRFGETGWSSAGNTGPSPLTLANQLRYMQMFRCAAAAANYEYFYFEAKDALWKKGQPQCEQNFGVFSSAFTQKFNLNLLGSC